MRSRTDSESVATSMPSTSAVPPLSGRSPVSILMTVVFPLPLGPRKPKISPFPTRKLTSLFVLSSRRRHTRFCAEMAASAGAGGIVATASILRLQFHVGSHAGQHLAGWIADANLHPKNLVHAFLAGLDIARQEFSLLVDLFEDSFKDNLGKGVDSDFGLLPKSEAAIFGFRNIDANVDLVFFKKCGNRGIRSNEIARANVEHLNDGSGRSDDLALAESRFVVGVGCSGEVDVFAAVAALEFFEVRLRLMEMRFGGGDFLRAVTALQFVQFVQGALLLGRGDFPIGFGGIALLFGD